MTNESNQNYAVGNSENRVNGDFTIRPLTTSIDIKTLRQLMGSWHSYGLSDTQIRKMLHLYFGEPAWMDLGKTYPRNNFSRIAEGMKFRTKQDFIEVLLRCKGFGIIWKNPTAAKTASNLLAFYTPIWHEMSNEENIKMQEMQENLHPSGGYIYQDNYLYYYNNKKKYIKKNNNQYDSSLQDAEKSARDAESITAAAQQLIRYIATNTDAYANVVKPINEMTLQLMPELPFDPSSSCPATDATVRFINEHLYPYILQHGERLMHIRTLQGQSCWLANLIKKDFMMKKISIAVNDARRYLARHPQERLRANRSDNGLEYQDPETGQRFYDTLLPDGTRKQHRIPQEAPPREQPDTVWSKHQKAWVKEIKP